MNPRPLVFACFALLCALISPASFLSAAPDPRAMVPVVEMGQVKAVEFAPALEYVGHVEPVAEVAIRPRVEAYVESVGFTEGALVNKGEVLFTLESAPFRARLARARALVRAAEAELERAESLLERYRRAADGVVSEADMEEALAAARKARAQLDLARAERDLAEIDLGYATITAPISGRIGKNLATAGNLVSPATLLGRLVQVDPVRVVFSLSERELALLDSLAAGKLPPPTITLPDGSGYPRPGRLDFVDNQVDPKTGTIPVRLLFDNPDSTLVAGEYVTVHLPTAPKSVKAAVPQGAVMLGDAGHYLLAVDGENQVVVRPVTLGEQVGGDWIVEQGVSPGDEIIVSGIQKVRPGMRVKPLRRREGR